MFASAFIMHSDRNLQQAYELSSDHHQDKLWLEMKNGYLFLHWDYRIFMLLSVEVSTGLSSPVWKHCALQTFVIEFMGSRKEIWNLRTYSWQMVAIWSWQTLVWANMSVLTVRWEAMQGPHHMQARHHKPQQICNTRLSCFLKCPAQAWEEVALSLVITVNDLVQIRSDVLTQWLQITSCLSLDFLPCRALLANMNMSLRWHWCVWLNMTG